MSQTKPEEAKRIEAQMDSLNKELIQLGLKRAALLSKFKPGDIVTSQDNSGEVYLITGFEVNNSFPTSFMVICRRRMKDNSFKRMKERKTEYGLRNFKTTGHIPDFENV